MKSNIIMNTTPLKEILGEKLDYMLEIKLNDDRKLLFLLKDISNLRESQIVIEEERLNDADSLVKILKELAYN